jgi:hypothetical protein
LRSSLSGAPEVVLDQIVPEDWADLRLILAQTNMRFMGMLNLLDEKEEDKNENPTAAGEDTTPPPSSAPTSAA